MKGHGDFSIGSNVWPGASKLLEEMGELQQALGKLIATHGEVGHWDGGKDLDLRIQEELADAWAAIQFMVITNNLQGEVIRRRSEEKLATFMKWHNEQQTRTPF